MNAEESKKQIHEWLLAFAFEACRRMTETEEALKFFEALKASEFGEKA